MSVPAVPLPAGAQRHSAIGQLPIKTNNVVR